jgi:ADP-ribose pyrophosphatase YjhB (NUDIX family)
MTPYDAYLAGQIKQSSMMEGFDPGEEWRQNFAAAGRANYKFLTEYADKNKDKIFESTLRAIERSHGGCVADHVRELSKGDGQITRERIREAHAANRDKQAAEDWKTRPGVRAVVHDEQGKVLLLRRPKTEEFHPDTWNLPGGAKEKDESHREGAHRELHEEAGLKAHATGASHTFHFPGGQGKAYQMYLQGDKAKTRIQKKEVAEAAWFDRDKLPKKLFPQTAAIVKALAL